MGWISAIALQRALDEGRRGATRYAIHLGLHYSATRRTDAPLTGTGESINISRTGMLFRADKRLQVGDSVLAVLDWPVPAPDGEALKAVVTGQIVRARYPVFGLTIHTHKLLRERELKKRLDNFWGSFDQSRPASADIRPVALVVDEDSVALSLSLVLVPQNWTIERAAPQDAPALLRAGDTRIGLLVTSDPAVLDSAPPDLPAILTIDPSATAEPVPIAGNRTHVATITKPVTDASLRALVVQLCPIPSRTAGGTPV
jgi:hypothetical protein